MNIQSDKNYRNNFGFATIPGEKSVIGGGAYFVNKDSKHPKDAFDFILYLMQQQTQLKLAKAGLSTPLKSVYDNPDVQSDPHMPPLKTSLTRGGIYLEAGPDADMISEVLANYIQKVWNNELSPEEALSKAQSEIEKKRKEIFTNLNSTK
jgi:ABC-type glycerol-3-phosphate transport system substrate-binding protein